MKKYIKLKGPVIYLLTMLLFDFIGNQVVKAQDNWRCPMLGNLNGPVVILQADDYIYNCGTDGKGPCQNADWTRFFNIIRNNKICAEINVITGWCTGGDSIIQLLKEKYLNELNESVNRFDFLSHTKSHENMACKTFDEQYNEIDSSQLFFHDVLGFESHGLLPPENAINQLTVSAIDDYNSKNKDLLTILLDYGFNIYYCDGRTPGPMIDNTGWNFLKSNNYGSKYGVPDYGDNLDYSHLLFGILPMETYDEQGRAIFSNRDFLILYDRGQYAETPVLLFDMHPASDWDYSNGFNQLIDLIAFLKSKNALFVTPTYLYNKANNEHYCGDYYDIENVNAMNSLSLGTSSQCSYTMVHDAANVSFTASKGISLKPGFTAEYGSTFDAYIVPKVSLKSQQTQKTKPIEKIESTEIKVNVYPNPNNGIFTVDFGNQSDKEKSIFISDLYGHEIKRVNSASSKESIDVSNQPSGIYVVQILSNNRLKTIKIVKDH
jgi:peptidoglycan/xylan/chitin deacetylase (PgdA/CDA1 family)